MFPIYGMDPQTNICACGRVNCPEPGAHPIGEWRSQSTVNEEKLKKQKKSHPSANWGIPLGSSAKQSKWPIVLIAVEISAEAWRSALTEEDRSEFQTYSTAVAATVTYFFDASHETTAGLAELRTIKEIIPGITLRGSDDFVLAPGARTASGLIEDSNDTPPDTNEDTSHTDQPTDTDQPTETYHLPQLRPEDLEPNELLQYLSRQTYAPIPTIIREKLTERRLENLADFDDTKLERTERYETLFREGLLYLRSNETEIKEGKKKNPSSRELTTALLKINQALCVPPLTEGDVAEIVRGVITHAKKHTKTFDRVAKYTKKDGPMLQSNEHLISVAMEENEFLKGMIYEDALTGAVTFHEDWLEKRANLEKPLFNEPHPITVIRPAGKESTTRKLIEGEFEYVRWTDVNTTQLIVFLQEDLRFKVAHATADSVVRMIAARYPRDRRREWLTQLEWDHTKRIDTAFASLYGIPDEPDEETGLTKEQRKEYATFIGRNLFLGPVERTLKPGCKNDLMIILIGEQGIGKSMGLREIFGESVVVDAEHDIGTPKFYQSTEQAMIIEFAELDKFNKADMNVVKRYGSSQSHTYMRAYARNPSVVPMRSIVVGTTNEKNFLRDATGERRNLPIEVFKFDRAFAKQNRVQLFAEAVHRIRSGETFYELPSFIKAVHAAHKEERVWDSLVEAFIKGRPTVKFIDLLNGPLKDLKRQPTTNDLSTCLKSFGWEKIKTTHERFWASPAEIEDRKTRARAPVTNIAERKQRIADLMDAIDEKNETEKKEKDKDHD